MHPARSRATDQADLGQASRFWPDAARRIAEADHGPIPDRRAGQRELRRDRPEIYEDRDARAWQITGRPGLARPGLVRPGRTGPRLCRGLAARVRGGQGSWRPRRGKAQHLAAAGRIRRTLAGRGLAGRGRCASGAIRHPGQLGGHVRDRCRRVRVEHNVRPAARRWRHDRQRQAHGSPPRGSPGPTACPFCHSLEAPMASRGVSGHHSGGSCPSERLDDPVGALATYCH